MTEPKKKIWFFRWDVQQHIYLFLPLVWLEFKRYYEDHGKHSDKWEWIPPVMDYTGQTLDDVVEEAINANADVYMFSSYMWSWDIIKIIALAVREAHPNALIVLGGPNQGTTYTDPIFWFKDHPYFDATCQAVEYGEFFITDMLDSVIEGTLDWNNVRNSYHRRGKGPLGNKKEFSYPWGLIEKNLDICYAWSEYAKNNDRVLVTLYETNRGCPYSCSYCEWGGGTSTKVIVKDLENIRNDFSYFKDLNVGSVFITDANYGILKQDVDIAHMIAAMKDHVKFGGIMGLAKSSVEKKKAVLEPLFESGVLQFYQVSLQSIDPQVLKNVERFDIPAEDNVNLAKYFIEKYDAETLIELIIGLPGSTIPVFYEEMEIEDAVFNKIKTVSHHVPLYVLPDAPIADPAYLEKFKMKLAGINMETMDLLKQYSDSKYIVNFKQKFPKKQYAMYIPVSCYSYTEEEWKEMFLMNDMKIPLINNLLVKPLVDYLNYHKGLLPRYSYKIIHTAMWNCKQFKDPVNEYLESIINGTRENLPWREFNVGPVRGDFSINEGLIYCWVSAREEIFKSLREQLLDYMDETLDDLLTYVENSTFRENPNDTIEWETKYRWDLYEERKAKEDPPVKGKILLKTTPNTNIKWTDQYINMIRNMDTVRVVDGTYIKNRTFETKKIIQGNKKEH